jgi:hypothetical protein
MYSDNIEKICDVCLFSKKVKGSATHLECTLDGSYVPLSHSCGGFKYDILKKRVRRRPEFVSHFTAEDFKL